MKTTTLALAFLISLCLNLDAFAKKNCDPENFPDISKSDLQAKIDKKEVFVIDVNSKSSYSDKHIPTAIHYGSEKNRLAQKLPQDKNKLIVAYCGGPSCTAWEKAAMAACELGYTKIQHFKGGIRGWKKSS